MPYKPVCKPDLVLYLVSFTVALVHQCILLMKDTLTRSKTFLSIYKKLKQLKTFLIKIRPTVPLTGAPLIRPKGLTKGWGRLVSSMFSTKSLILFTPAISYTHLLYPCITFLWHTLYFPLHMHSLIIHLIICFRRIIIDIIVYRRKERCVLFLEGK